MINPNRVSISLQSLEVLTDFGTESDRAGFIDWLYRAYNQLAAVEDISLPETESRALLRAAEYTIPETTATFQRYVEFMGNLARVSERGTE
jgi:hypothetical protein